MSVRQIWTCDRCGTDEPSKEGGGLPIGWARADIRFHDLPKMNHGQYIRILDLCEPCQDELKRVWDDWLAPSEAAAESSEPEFKRGDVVKCIDVKTVSEVETVRCRLGKDCHYIVDAVDAAGTLQLKDVPGWYRPERFLFVERAFAGPGVTSWPQGSVGGDTPNGMM